MLLIDRPGETDDSQINFSYPRARGLREQLSGIFSEEKNIVSLPVGWEMSVKQSMIDDLAQRIIPNYLKNHETHNFENTAKNQIEELYGREIDQFIRGEIPQISEGETSESYWIKIEAAANRKIIKLFLAYQQDGHSFIGN